MPALRAAGMDSRFTIERVAMTNILYLDCEFTDLLQPELLSLAIVSIAGDEHYVELDLDDPASEPTLSRASDFARHSGVLAQWGRVPGGAGNREQMGQRTARWVLDQATRFGQPAHIGYDYASDYELFETLLRDAGQWATVREVVLPLYVGEWTDRFDGNLGAAAAYEWVRRRGLDRHHALADAHALRAAHYAVMTGKRVKL